ncbi:thiol reductant ABC exporter subunit CydD [Acetobacter malorum]|uniref:ABC transporter ATP-binding protein n=1 Tax=Acetobacter malorum TaxID=178901 RepID=A0A1Y3G8I2_9PROT|nr:thiol reductant ABC exporter subunit CydD [Acetobacter malorum]OUJ07397.1 ABC transporter ATP-binding protein [Acetobacter malorum]
MSGDKAAIRGWTRTQSRLGRQAARPVVVFGLLSSLLGVGQAWCVATVLGHALVGLVSGGSAQTLALWPVLAFAGLALLRALIMALSDTAAAKAGIDARRRLRGEVLASILTGGPALLRKTHSGELATIAVDRIEALDGFFARWVPASVLWIAAPLLILLPVAFVQPRAALVLGLCGAAVPFGQALFGIGAAVASRNQFLAMTRLQARFLDRVKGIATIVLAGRADDETERLGQAAEELRQRTMKILRVAFLSSASIDCAMVVALVLIAIMDGKQAMALLSGGVSPALAYTLTSGLFVLLVIPEFFAPLRGLALAYQDRAHAQGAATAILDLPEAQPRPSPDGARTVNASGVMVSLEDVCFTWDPARGPALDHVSFTVPAGETLILAGPSGSGKSTIMELLLGFIQPDSGSVRFNGAPLDSIVPDSLSRMISWIGQKPVLFAGTLKDNILFARPDADEADLMAAVKAAAVDQFLPSLPDGLETRIGEGGFGLSGGQAQRIAIARAYLKNAPILLLDEPTAHLDPATEKSVFESLQRLALRRTVVLATHSAAVHMFNGRRVDLQMGRVVARQGAA